MNGYGNRLWRADTVATSLGKAFDELYSYDGLHRLKDMQRGTLNGSHTSISASMFAQCWSLDPTSNWRGFKEAAIGGPWTLDQVRSANTVNEITGITNSTGPTWTTPAYDTAGNTTTLPQPADPTKSYTATYDAWNRLVRLEQQILNPLPTLIKVSENEYDARTFRTVRRDYTAGALATTRHFYYTPGWRCIEERLGTTPDTAAPERQFVWGNRYIDDLVCRDRSVTGTLDERLYATQDANWNVVALIDTTGTVQERYAYAAYGMATVLDSGFVSRTSSSYQWETTYCGYRWDANTGLLAVRNRFYHPLLGRWINRDPIGYADGMSLYGAYFVPNGVDPYGLKIYGFGGTNENGCSNQITSWLVDSIIEEGEFFCGPGSDFNGSVFQYAQPESICGMGADAIAARGVSTICADVCKDDCSINDPINLAGWSRGAVIAIEVARRLRNDGCCCKRTWYGRCYDRRYPTIDWIGLVDPVRMMPCFGFGGQIPDNVSWVSVATTEVDSLYENTVFPPLSITSAPGSKTEIELKGFNCTHFEIGSNRDTLNWMLGQAGSCHVPVAGHYVSGEVFETPRTTQCNSLKRNGYVTDSRVLLLGSTCCTKRQRMVRCLPILSILRYSLIL